MREPKLPPKTSFTSCRGMASGSLRGGASCAPKMMLCLESRPVNQVDNVLFRLRHLCDVLFRHVAGLPSGKKFFQLGLDRRQSGIAHNQQRCVVGLEPCVMPLGQVFTRELAYAGFSAGAGKRQRIRMPFAIKKLRHHAQGHGLRLHFFTPDGGNAVLLQTANSFCGNAGCRIRSP